MMYDLENQIKEVEQELDTQAKSQASVAAELSSALDTSLDEQALDIENAKLNEVWANQEKLNANIASLIMGLDQVTCQLGTDFDALREQSGMEKFIGIFSSQKADEMRADRIKEADISENLNDLIVQSNKIVSILQGQEKVLIEQLEKGEKNLSHTIEQRQQTVESLEQVKQQLNQLDPKLIDLENQISEAADPAKRASLEAELHELNQQYNSLRNQEQSMLVKSQTLEKYIDMNKTNVDSLHNQKTAQQVLIDKLKTDTAQRVILFEQYQHSLKTSQQQDVAHRLNEIGSAVDRKTQEGMAHIAAATNNRLMDMMESHSGNMQASKDIMAKKARADERFMRRFQNVVAKHDSADYDQ
ncbi:hypothetical protein [Spartinivicinus marinus]|nr:hypothetical protein [Spartinivicinus marinus]